MLDGQPFGGPCPMSQQRCFDLTAEGPCGHVAEQRSQVGDATVRQRDAGPHKPARRRVGEGGDTALGASRLLGDRLEFHDQQLGFVRGCAASVGCRAGPGRPPVRCSRPGACLSDAQPDTSREELVERRTRPPRTGRRPAGASAGLGYVELEALHHKAHAQRHRAVRGKACDAPRPSAPAAAAASSAMCSAVRSSPRS